MPLPCPDCSAPLTVPVGEACARCGLPLRGPAAARLYDLDTRLTALAIERGQVLDVLRAARTTGSARAQVVPGQQVVPEQQVAPVRPRRSPQALLLGLGALLLLVATSVFLAVVWLLIGVVGQVAVMTAATAGAGAASVATARRGLGSTATTCAVLAAGLTAVSVQGGRSLGLAGLEDLPVLGAVALATGLGTVLSAVVARSTGLAVYAAQAVVTSALVLPAALLAADAEPWLLLAATGSWAVGALALARLRPGLLLAPAAGTAATVLGGVVLLGTVAAGLLVTGTDLPGRGLRAGVVVAVLTVGALVAGLRLERRVLPVAAPAVGAAGLLLVLRAAEVLGADRALVVTLAASAAWAVAGGLLVVRRTPATWCAGAAATAAGLALGAAALRQDWSSVSALSAGLAVSAAVAALLHQTDWRVLASAVPVGTGAAGAALVAGVVAVDGPAGVAVAVAVGVGVLATLSAAWCSPEPEEPGLGAVALLALLGALLGTRELPDPTSAAAAVLAVGGLLGLGYACLPARGWASVGGVASSSAASWTLLSSTHHHLLELYTLPVAALLLVVGLARAHWLPEAPSWSTVGPAVSMALLPSAQLGVGDPGSVRALTTTAAAALVLLLGVRLHLRALVLAGGVVVLELGLAQLGQAALYLPRWTVLALLGGLLLAAGATYEARVAQARSAGRWVRALR